MMDFLKRKETYIGTGIVALLSVSILFPSVQWSTKICTLIQALAIVTLVGVTWFYAKQTKRLVEESIKDRDELIKKRNIDFYEQTIILFYHPILTKLNDLDNIVRKQEVTAEELNRVLHDVGEFYNEKRYMVSEEMCSKTGGLIVDFVGATVDQDPNSKKKFFESSNKLRSLIVEEWKKTENKIREFYGLKGGQDEKS